MRILYLPNSKCQQRQFEKPNFMAYPWLLAAEAEWHRQNGDTVIWDYKPKCHMDRLADYADKIITEPEGLPFLSLPHPDRIFTNAMDKKYQNNGNFKYHPGTYIQSASGCWWGKCTFCVENVSRCRKSGENNPFRHEWGTNQLQAPVDKTPTPEYEVRPVDDCIAEIEEIKALNYKEIFDDSGTFPTGRWLDDFCKELSRMDFRKDTRFGCNIRCRDMDFRLLHRVGFRMLLFGIESANQETLDRINKGVKVEDIKYIIKASEAGLEPHICVIFGYPWETDDDAIRTLRMVHDLLKKGYAKTAQASFYTKQGVVGRDEHRRFIRKIYNVGYSPRFWFNKIKDIKNVDDLKYLWRQIKSSWQ